MNFEASSTRKNMHPSLLDTARLAHDLTSQNWSTLNTNITALEGYSYFESLVEHIVALLLIRIIALLHDRSETPDLPVFVDLSTTTICRTIIDDEARRMEDEVLAIEMDPLDWPELLTQDVVCELRTYVHKIFSMYQDVAYHNYEHGYHVFTSANKILDAVLCEHVWSTSSTNENDSPNDNTTTSLNAGTSTSTSQAIEKSNSTMNTVNTTGDFGFSDGGDDVNGDVKHTKWSKPIPKKLTRPTYGIKTDPIVHLAFLFSALVHDVDHKGVSNRQLVLESDKLAILYNDQSVAEQRSLAVAFTLLMNSNFDNLRGVLFRKGTQEFMRFRSTVIDLVLCTDISSPERVQIVKSKWKEAFGDKKKTEISPRRDSHQQLDDSNHNDHEARERKEAEQKQRQKLRNEWKSTPADPRFAEPTSNRNNLVRRFMHTRGSIAMGTSDEFNGSSTSRNSNTLGGQNTNDSVNESHGPTSTVSSVFSGSNPSSLLPSFSDFDDDGASSIDSDVSDNASAYSTCKETEEDFSFERTKRRHSTECLDPNKPKIAQHQSNVQGKKYRACRRFTEPPAGFNPPTPKKKFHLRLGIRRALDLTGSTIEAYDTCKKQEHRRTMIRDPDKPNALKSIVVLEQMLKMSDIAANSQKWEIMLKWSAKLFFELKFCYVTGRGDDPSPTWHENQIAFFESYSLPLAFRLVETEVLEEEMCKELIQNVKENNVRWMIEGRLELDKLIKEWNQRQPKRSYPSY
mmetsp:Transcript_8010/g.9233  ORF Transcript_8010/g.9233 Transcript_8010/m.9233 type:complete len:741 (+) Transcript_8010:50-2272(+)